MVVVEKGVLHSAESSALAASRACFLLMPTRALQAVSLRSAPSARFIWYLCRVDGVDARSLIKDAGVAQYFPPLVHGGRALWRVSFDLCEEGPHLSRDRLNTRGATRFRREQSNHLRDATDLRKDALHGP